MHQGKKPDIEISNLAQTLKKPDVSMLENSFADTTFWKNNSVLIEYRIKCCLAEQKLTSSCQHKTAHPAGKAAERNESAPTYSTEDQNRELSFAQLVPRVLFGAAHDVEGERVDALRELLLGLAQRYRLTRV